MEGTSKMYHLKSHDPVLVTGRLKTWGIIFWATLLLQGALRHLKNSASLVRV
jgi:hypothetical protein